MSWEWSHTTEALEYARKQVFELDRETLLTILAENYTAKHQAEHAAGGPDFDEEAYEKFLARFEDLPADTMAESVWAFAEELCTCDNGGHNAHLCFYGCGCHTVPFSPEA